MTTAHRTGWIPEITRGTRYRLAREQAGYGSGEFAELIGVSRNTVSAVENDRTGVRRIVRNAWATATGVPAVWLETGETPPSGGDGGASGVRPEGFEPPTFCSGHRAAVSSIRGRRRGRLVSSPDPARRAAA